MNEKRTIELHIFTNSTMAIESHQTIFSTIDSFKDMFGEVPFHIWCDRNPNTGSAPGYIKWLIHRYGHENITLTSSLSDGYIKAVTQSKSDFMFMLEHDWIFKKENIPHSLDDICKLMKDDKIHHLRFNMFPNELSFDDNAMREIHPDHFDFIKATGIRNSTVPYLTVSSASNNPHIINRELYTRDLFHLIKLDERCGGIEHNLRNIDNALFAIYGDEKTTPCVEHIDGRLGCR